MFTKEEVYGALVNDFELDGIASREERLAFASDIVSDLLDDELIDETIAREVIALVMGA